jgi:hypothetical protein
MNYFYSQTTIDGSAPANVMPEVEITTKQNNSSNDIQSSDCISVLLGNGSASILGSYPTANSKVKSQDLNDMHN